MKLISKHFPKQHKYYAIFNKNTIKLSYSCMPNMSSMIKRHKVLEQKRKVETEERKCNCRDKTTVRWRVNVLQNVLCTKQLSVA